MFWSGGYFYALLVIWILVCCRANEVKLKVSIFYEALCPDSVRFFNSQLKPAYPIIGDSINIEFIPYGKANHFKRNGKWSFRCHHGFNECYANQIQACAVHENVDQKFKANFLLCLMSFPRYGLTDPTNIKKCAEENSILPNNIFNCMRGDLKDELLAQHGDKTQAVDPLISFVPTIIFNNVYSPYVQNDALDDFLGTVCEKLNNPPSNCRSKQIQHYWLF